MPQLASIEAARQRTWNGNYKLVRKKFDSAKTSVPRFSREGQRRLRLEPRLSYSGNSRAGALGTS